MKKAPINRSFLWFIYKTLVGPHQLFCPYLLPVSFFLFWSGRARAPAGQKQKQEEKALGQVNFFDMGDTKESPEEMLNITEIEDFEDNIQDILIQSLMEHIRIQKNEINLLKGEKNQIGSCILNNKFSYRHLVFSNQVDSYLKIWENVHF